MIIAQFDILRYQLPLKKPLSIHRHSLKSRDGLVIKLFDCEGNSGLGEIAPLPGLSRESLNAAISQTNKIRKKLLNKKIPDKIEALSGKFEAWLGPHDLLPSVRFGLEMAILNLLANSQGKSFALLVKNDCQTEVSLNGLLQGTREEIMYQARQMVKRGFRSVKLKVGSKNFHADIEKVKLLRKIIKNHSTIRLDANQNWDFKTALKFAEAIGISSIEYIEEPFRNWFQIPEFYKKTKIPVALDESVSKSFLKIGKLNGLKAVILKPTVLGGFETAMRFTERAHRLKIQVVISSSFESGIGITALANFAACVNRQDIPCGLDTLKWFREDLLKIKLVSQNGKFTLRQLAGNQNSVQFRLLRNINED